MGTERLSYGFGLDEQNELVSVTDVLLLHSIEADADGRIRQHVWIEGRAEPRVDCDGMSVDLEFVLWDGDEELGRCCAEALEMEGKGTRKVFKADDDLRIGQNAKVCKMDMAVAARTLHRFESVELQPEAVEKDRG